MTFMQRCFKWQNGKKGGKEEEEEERKKVVE
jgi:hypothetical protein